MTDRVMIVQLSGCPLLMGKVSDDLDDPEKMVFENPVIVGVEPRHNEQGQIVGMELIMIPWLPFSAPGTTKFFRNQMIVVSEPSVEVLNRYNQQFGSNLVIAKNVPQPQPQKPGAKIISI